MRSDLPSGTVTFVFTDVEGSTRLLGELGAEAYAAALAEHRGVVRAACASHDGVEVDTQGDALFVAFATAPGALAACAGFTHALADGPIRVRVGVHTGTPLLTEEGYVGHDVHRAARIAAAGHGGQVLVSSATAALVGDAGLRDLGEHRFKDLQAAERVYQLGEEGEFPPLRSLYRSNLPVPATPFLGRDPELADVVALLSRDDVRLLTLTGPGGTGKTRLALQAAADASDSFPDGVWWVPLAALRDPALIVSSLAHVLEVKERPGRSLLETVVEHLSGKRPLVLLDNVEHLLPAAAGEIARLRAACGPTLLVTSRERLQVEGEHSWPVLPLEMRDGIELFLARARQVDPSFVYSSTVDELCERLDQLPLALELAAARTSMFSAEQLIERLSQRLDLLKGGRDADPRQQTLRATIDWSFGLLNREEQRVFRALSVFAGGCTYEAAEAVVQADADTTQSLIDKNLVRRRETDFGSRYWMLETVREYAAERLGAAPDRDDLRDRHARWFHELVKEAEPQLVGVEQRTWLDRLTAEHDNLRAALAYLDRDRVARLGMATSLWRFWQARNHLTEGRSWLTVPGDIEQVGGSEVAARLNVAASRMAWKQGDLGAGRNYAEAAYDVAVRANDGALLALAGENLGCVVAFTELQPGCDLLAESVTYFRRVGDHVGLASALNNLGCIQSELGQLEEAASSIEESIRVSRRTGNAYGLGSALHSLGYVNLFQAAFEKARPLLAEALLLFRDLGDVAAVGDTLEGLGHCAEAAGETYKAAVLWAAGEALRERGGFEVDLMERALGDVAQPRVEAQLGARAFATAWEEGRGLSLDAAIAVVLGTARIHA